MRGTIVIAGILSFFVLSAPAFAQGDVPKEATTEQARAETAEATEAANGNFSCTGCAVNSWIWTKVSEAWRYESGSEERIWCYILSGYTGNYAEASTADARARMFIEAASSGHWLGLFHLAGGQFSNVRLWWN
jgi:hypothetical protein